jgi:hypothetical protein
MMPELGNLVDIRLVTMLTSTRVSAGVKVFIVLAIVGK